MEGGKKKQHTQADRLIALSEQRGPKVQALQLLSLLVAAPLFQMEKVPVNKVHRTSEILYL